MEQEGLDDKKVINKKIIENVIISIVLILYFILIGVLYFKMGENIIFNVLKIVSIASLIFSIVIFEIAYHKDSGKLAINGIEALVFSIYSLTIWQVIYKLKVQFDKYIIFSACIFLIYYVIKSILIITRERKKYLDSLSDIHEIVQKEPIKKEARKRKSN